MGNKKTGSGRHDNTVQVSTLADRTESSKAEKSIKTAAIIRPFFTRWLHAATSSAAVREEAGDSCRILKFDAKADLQSVQARIDECQQKLDLLDRRQTEIESVRLHWYTENVLIKKRLERAACLQQFAMQRLDRANDRQSCGVLEQSYRNFEMQAVLLKQKHAQVKATLAESEQQLHQVSVQIQTTTALLQQLIIDNGLQQAA